ncbi:MAG: xanthine dehydrogenase family protein molybdopterin-binding subunit [Geminicoccaceae bacterium]|nr:MAG: xanthine dehydrogenase family protein molybdopterin-binding subunit [Geminicoccaceae bacterium]
MSVIGRPTPRVDGPAKVGGLATYAAEFHPEGLVHAALVAAPTGPGHVAAIATEAAARRPGVLAVLTHENAPRLAWQPLDPAVVDPSAGEQVRLLADGKVHFAGEPVAVVVAKSEERARDAAAAVRVRVERNEGVGMHFDPGRGRIDRETSRGDGEGNGEGSAAFGIEATHEQPRLYHNAIEPHATVAAWDDAGGLTVWDKSQWVGNVRHQLARNFGMDEDMVRVVSPFVGGAFGAALRCWPHVTLAALAARAVGRPVRIELRRRELYTAIGYRPQTRQTVRLRADAAGHLLAVRHRVWAETSAYEDYDENVTGPSAMLYDVPAVTTSHALVPLDTNTPTPMRGPGAVAGMFALELAMDEMAEAVGLDPLEFRLRNYAERDRAKDLPFSSKALRACYAEGAKRFGWAGRHPERRAMRDGRDLVGYGMATAIWPAHRAPATIRVRLFANGSAVVRTAASDMGPGTYTSMSQV